MVRMAYIHEGRIKKRIVTQILLAVPNVLKRISADSNTISDIKNLQLKLKRKFIGLLIDRKVYASCRA